LNVDLQIGNNHEQIKDICPRKQHSIYASLGREHNHDCYNSKTHSKHMPVVSNIK